MQLDAAGQLFATAAQSLLARQAHAVDTRTRRVPAACRRQMTRLATEGFHSAEARGVDDLQEDRGAQPSGGSARPWPASAEVRASTRSASAKPLCP